MRALVISIIALLSLGACFEDGPLIAELPGASGGDADIILDIAPELPLETIDTLVPDVASELPPPDVGLDADVAPDAEPGTPCLTDEQCAGEGPVDLCAGEVRCIGFECQVDPASVVSCPVLADPCVDSYCDAATGACATLQLCTCEPAGSPLGCGKSVSFSTADSGATQVMGPYTCSGDAATVTSAEHVWVFEAPQSETVIARVESEGGAKGVWVVGLTDAGACDADACIAAGPDGVGFSAVAGKRYAFIVEHGPAFPAAVKLSVQCGAQPEEQCADGVDEDLNGFTDCDDSACASKAACIPAPEAVCTDNIDDDNDGDTDCADSDCAATAICLQPCDVGIALSCGGSQGISNGGGKALSTEYAVGPPAPGKEVVYKFSTPVGGPVAVTLSAPATSELALYGLEEKGLGCTPTAAFAYGPWEINFNAAPGAIYYFVVDGQSIGAEATFQIAIECGD